MPHELQDFHSAPLTVANDATERTLYEWPIPPGSITTATLFRLLISGKVSSRALLPGTIALTIKCGGVAAIVLSETMLLGVNASGFVANLDSWIIPAASGLVAVGGFFSQNGSDLFVPAGARSQSSIGAIDLSVENRIVATVQFGTADPGNICARSIAALMVLSG